MGGLHSTEVVTSHPAATGLILGIPKNLSLDVADIIDGHYLKHWTEA